MRTTVALLVLMLAFAAAPASAQATATLSPASEAEWHAFQSHRGRFQVVAPSEPERLLDSQWTLAGRIEEVAYHFQWRGARFGVTYHDLPAIASLLYSPEGLLERAVDELMEVMEGEPVGEGPVRLEGHPGRAVTYVVRDRRERMEEARFFLVGDRLYLLEAALPPGGAADDAAARDRADADEAIRRFFGSFRLLEDQNR